MFAILDSSTVWWLEVEEVRIIFRSSEEYEGPGCSTWIWKFWSNLTFWRSDERWRFFRTSRKSVESWMEGCWSADVERSGVGLLDEIGESFKLWDLDFFRFTFLCFFFFECFDFLRSLLVDRLVDRDFLFRDFDLRVCDLLRLLLLTFRLLKPSRLALIERFRRPPGDRVLWRVRDLDRSRVRLLGLVPPLFWLGDFGRSRNRPSKNVSKCF